MGLEWGFILALYFFLAGAGAGAFMFAVGVEFMGKGEDLKPFVMSGTLIAGPLAAIGTLFLILDLGWVEVLNIQPWRLFLLYLNFNPTSLISWGTWILTLFIPISFLYGITKTPFNFVPKIFHKILMYSGLLLAFAAAIYTGLDVSIVSAIPFWNHSMVPVLFLLSALSTGLAAAILGGYILDRSICYKIQSLYKIMVALVIADLFFFAFLLFITAHSTVEERLSTSLLLSGVHSHLFWFRGVAFLFVIFFVPASLSILKKSPHIGQVILIAPIVVLAGGLALRYLILAAGVPISLF